MANTSYKTKLCFRFLKDGHCHFGSRCNYIHKAQPAQRARQQTKLNNFGDIILDLEERPGSRLLSLLDREL